MAGNAYIGTSGWNYEAWKDNFYHGVRRKDWLRFCAEHFTGIEVNATFYRLQEKRTFERWRDETPEHFRFAIKGNRFLTHNKKLNEPLASIRLDRERAQSLGDKLAAVVWQMPAQLRKNMEKLRVFALALQRWPDTRHALEFRHISWFDEEVADCLRAHQLAVCISDAADWPMWDAVTTDMVYVRLHGHTRTYASAYSAASLKNWARRIRAWLKEGRGVHVYFDNDAEGAAPSDALRLIHLVDRGKRTA
ncbi:MAG: DUF72 domain-containing protein [Acidiferrobacterales bacterium]